MTTNKHKEQNDKKKISSVVWLSGIGIVLIVGICLAVFFGGRADEGKIRTVGVKTTYMTVQYPETYHEYLKHEEILDGPNATEVFFMVYNDVEAELFRLSFTQTEMESVEGFLNTENGALYVSLSASGVDSQLFVPEQAEESEIDVEMEALYYSMMEGMSTVMESIRQDSRFSTYKGISENDKQGTSLTYWTVTLPSGIIWEEKTEGSVYSAVFYGNVGEKKIQLYTISLGDTTAESPVGQYVANGETKIVSVEIHDLNAGGDLSEEEKAAAYVLMDTVNDVLQAIRDDENFHDQLEPAA